MNASIYKFTACSLLAISLGVMPGSRAAYAQQAPAVPRAFLMVNAPNAQRLVESVARAHGEATLVGLHLTPPDRKENVIIACTDVLRVGKPSSEGDLAVMKSGKSVVRLKEKDGVYDIQMPLLDSHGKLIGMMVELVSAKAVSTQEEAVAAAESLRSDLQAKLSSEAWLYKDDLKENGVTASKASEQK